MQSDVNMRRAARRKKIRRRRLKIFFVFMLIIALITAGIMCFTVFFPIKKVNVSGSKIYSKSQIIKASGLTTDDKLFAVSEEKIENSIRKSLPYIEDVKLKRAFPDAVSLTVTDAKEYAFYESKGQYFILSDSGYVLKTQTEPPQNVFQIITSGIKGEVSQKAVYKNSAEQELIEMLIKELSSKKLNIDKIDVSNVLEITLQVEDRFTVKVGTSQYLSEKIAHLGGMIKSIPDRSGTINLSMWTPQNAQGTFKENKN